MSLYNNPRFQERVHDFTIIVVLPFMLYVSACAVLFPLYTEKISIRMPAHLQQAADTQALWWILQICLIPTLCIAGRITAFVWSKEKYWEMDPPPLRIIRKWGFVFCWSDHMTNMALAPFRWLRLPRIPLPKISTLSRRVEARMVAQVSGMPVHIPKPVTTATVPLLRVVRHAFSSFVPPFRPRETEAPAAKARLGPRRPTLKLKRGSDPPIQPTLS